MLKRLGINWKYAFGEILLLFVGITLAIAFNNWNSNNQTQHNRNIALQKINAELATNLEELQFAHDNNASIEHAFEAFQPYYAGNSSEIHASMEQMNRLQEEFPNFFRVKEQVALNDSIFHFTGDSYILLELPELSDIAWETARNMAITNAFAYDCLFQLEGIYNLQQRAMTEIDKAAQNMLDSDLPKLIGLLKISGQINEQLLTDYRAYLDQPEACK